MPQWSTERRSAGTSLIPLILVLALVLPCAALAVSNRGAVLRSVALPGWGQHHLGHGGLGNVFLGLEIATWAGVGLSYLEGSFNRDDYVSLALEEAGLSVRGRPHDFLEDIGDFMSSDEYNDYVRRLARYYYPDDPDRQREYYESHARYGADSWSWSSESAMLEFRDLYRVSRLWFRRSLYIAAFALVNRAISAIDAALLDDRRASLYASIDFPDCYDMSSVRIMVGTRF
ncbi:hypothetical protein JW921_00400 [Candidatus Fermentibacterales bacterium]|nr:hypothetical protein [Candidatus Fermentibacterales bacterium]